ncbi:hypothetical protein OSB04_019436 [Centaurea solstitialis]|uniref:Uncharacterized protein n=1 Tax=Centaurea solstitialis TaxID=347529 RepID=A0AA38T9V6_9ASTR|nr:hypothetical protein OSB04_019436 [Centaurea solstitialis]
MDKSHPLSTPMVVRSLDVEKDPFRPPTDDEDILGPEVLYLSAIGAQIEIQFVSYEETLEWSKANIPISSRYERFGCQIPVRSSYRSLPNRICIHYRWYNDFVAFHKQTMVATSSNHAEILAIHEASRECVWLRNVIQHIRGSCGIISDKEPPTVLYEDNAACIA